MDIHGSSRGKASPEPASQQSSGRQADWLKGIGAGAFGLLIGFSLGTAYAPSTISPLPLLDTAAATPAAAPADAPVLPAIQAFAPPAPDDRRAVTGEALPLPPAVGAATAASWTSPLPSGLEPCWAERITVTC